MTYKNIIINCGWISISDTMYLKPHRHFHIPGNLYLKVRENFEPGRTHITIRFHKEEEIKSEYLFQGFLLEKTEEEFKTLLKQLDIPDYSVIQM